MARSLRASRTTWLGRLVLLAASALGLCSPLAALAVGADTLAGTGADTPAPLRVVSFNLFHDKDDWPARQRLIIAGLRELHPDVVVLNEVLQDTGLPNQARTLAEALGLQWRFASLDDPGHARRYGNAVLSRYPISGWQVQVLEPRDDYRSVARATLSVDGRAVDIVLTHLHHTDDGGAIRAVQVAGLLDFIATVPVHRPTLLAGDLNARIDAPEFATLTPSFRDAMETVHPGTAAYSLNPHYFSGAASGRRLIDHVLARRGDWDVRDARIVLDQPDAAGHWPSDHFGVLAELGFAPR